MFHLTYFKDECQTLNYSSCMELNLFVNMTSNTTPNKGSEYICKYSWIQDVAHNPI